MIYHYFLSANSSQGYVDWTARRAARLRRVVRTTGYPDSVLRALEGAALTCAKERGERLDIIHRPLDGGIAGLITPSRGAAVFNTPVWLDRSRHVSGLLTDTLRDEMLEQLTDACGAYAAAKQLHDEWEQIYIAETDYAKLNAATDSFVEAVIGGKEAETPGGRTDAFFGAGTPDGPIDYIACLTAELEHRYFLKGRPGTGKSTFLKKLADAAVLAGFDTEVYHCSFDPDSLDMVVVREKSLCVFDSTAPHEYFPTRTGDEIVDLYAAAVAPGTDERYAAQLSLMAKRYKVLTGRAAAQLALVRDSAAAMDADTCGQLDAERVAVTVEQLLHALFTA